MAEFPLSADDLTRFDHHSANHRCGAERRWAQMRLMDRLPRSEKYGGFHIVTRYADLRKASAQHSIFSTAMGVALPDEQRTPHIPEEVDPPLHREYRRIVEPYLSRAAIAELEPAARRIVVELLDAFGSRTEIEFVRGFAEPLPVYFALQAFGFPRQDAEVLNDLVARLIHGRASDDGKHASRTLTDYIEALLARKAATATSGSDDVVTAIAHGSVSNRPLTLEEQVSMTRLLLFGGFTTVQYALSYALYLLATHPELTRQLGENPGMLDTAIEEFLRLASPATYLRRTVMSDTELGGTALHPGDQVLLCFGAGNRDPTVFERPEDVVLDRKRNPHVAFGCGAHHCVGAWLARLEMRVALEELLRRYQGFQLDPAGCVKWGSGETQGLISLPLIVEPRVHRSAE